MENTLENKAKFFAQYWGQKTAKEEGSDNYFYSKPKVFPDAEFNLEYLELTPLSDITDEHAIEVAKIENDFEDPLLRGKAIIENFREYLDCSHFMKNSEQFLVFIDFLRSKGYALPWMGLSVEEQISFGWVKLKKETLNQ